MQRNFLHIRPNASARIDCLSKFKRRKSYFPEIHGGSKTKQITTNDFLVSINQAVYKELSYNLRMEVGVQTPEETLRIKSGSCRDFAWLLIHVLRHFGLAARFVSGYIVQLSPDVKSLDGPSGPKDFTDLHAWVEVYLPGGVDWT
jgi:transglutaminase-like putative cysteine protease